MLPKEEILKEKLEREGVLVCGICESKTYKAHMSDTMWIWEPGKENQPNDEQKIPPRGMGMFVQRNIKFAKVHASDDLMAIRVETDGDDLPFFVIETHFPHSTNIKEHKNMWDKIKCLVDGYIEQGHVVLMGDFNAHAKANGDDRTDPAGKLMMKRTKNMHMTSVNHMSVCKGSHTRVVDHEDGSRTSTTIDYVFVSDSLLGRVKEMTIGERMGSDHKIIKLIIEKVSADVASKNEIREVWRTENLPENRADRFLFVQAFNATMEEFIMESKDKLEAMEAVGIESRRIADILEWSFQAKLDEECKKQLGTKLVGPKATPMLTRAMRMLRDHKQVCEDTLKRIATNAESTADERARAVRLYRDAKRKLFTATSRRKEMAELEVFRQIEEKQGDSKLFWARAKKLTNRMRASPSPPAMVHNEEGEVESDPIQVLKIWRRFTRDIANTTPEEEGIYDEEHRREVEERLMLLRTLRLHQHEFDREITREEIFTAIRKLKMGKAPGVDGILTSILKSAADAVGTNKLKNRNTVVEALALIFNYVFANEVWPERWGSGIIFPLYKQDSILEPGNYRPITLLSVVGKLFGSVIEKRLSDWSERTGVMADEQGGFRRSRGTPDQIFLLREIISYRKERGLPTLVTYIDARKAYDTVWREGNYVMLFDRGVQGKMWRQIQAMSGDVKSKIRLSCGDTDWHEVLRGVAQGAVESPWLYSNFINDLADNLRNKNFGVMIGGIRIPLLMYADDIVLLANSVTELHQMNNIASDYAFKNRFRHNGDKSAVMVFNADPALKKRVSEQTWTLSGEKVEVKKKYKYLGVDTPSNLTDWRPHIKRVIAKAKFRSNDLLWMCRRDEGIRPRSAGTLWKAIVRPVLEYASEVWAGEIPKNLADEAEKIQTDFARSILGIGKRTVPNDFIRSEMGLETLHSRWEKLRLGYWRRIQVADPNRALHRVAALRRRHVIAGGDLGSNSWMKGTRDMLQKRNLARHWYNPTACANTPKLSWKEQVYYNVDGYHDKMRDKRMRNMTSMRNYLKVKQWEEMSSEKAEFAGEVSKLGSLVCERYLDDTHEQIACKLKLMCRANCLAVLSRVAVEEGFPRYWARCMLCDRDEIEDIEHFVMRCEYYTDLRQKMMTKVQNAFPVGTTYFQYLSDIEKFHVLLGADAGTRRAEIDIDFAVKRYLKRAWRKRKKLSIAVNKEFNRKDMMVK